MGQVDLALTVFALSVLLMHCFPATCCHVCPSCPCVVLFPPLDSSPSVSCRSLRMVRISVFQLSALAVLLLSVSCWADSEVGTPPPHTHTTINHHHNGYFINLKDPLSIRYSGIERWTLRNIYVVCIRKSPKMDCELHFKNVWPIHV